MSHLIKNGDYVIVTTYSTSATRSCDKPYGRPLRSPILLDIPFGTELHIPKGGLVPIPFEIIGALEMPGDPTEKFRGLLLVGRYAGNPNFIIRHNFIILLRTYFPKKLIGLIGNQNGDTTGLQSSTTDYKAEIGTRIIRIPGNILDIDSSFVPKKIEIFHFIETKALFLIKSVFYDDATFIGRIQRNIIVAFENEFLNRK
jgi:hypothetical protein